MRKRRLTRRPRERNLTYVREPLMIPTSVTEGSVTEVVGARLKRLRLQRELSQRDLSSPGVSYAYISRVESDARTPSVKALRKIANKLGVTVEHLETGEPTPTELGVADAGLEFGSLTKAEVREIRAAAAEGA